MPSRSALAERCLPEDWPVLLLVGLPEHKVLGVALLGRVLIRIVQLSSLGQPKGPHNTTFKTFTE